MNFINLYFQQLLDGTREERIKRELMVARELYSLLIITLSLHPATEGEGGEINLHLLGLQPIPISWCGSEEVSIVADVGNLDKFIL